MVKTKFWGTNSYVFRSYRGKTGREGSLPPPNPTILNRVRHDNCIIKLGLIPTSPIILTTLKNFTVQTTQESFWYNYVCLWQNCLFPLLKNTSVFCSMFGINDAWLFMMKYLPQRFHKVSKARHNNYVIAFQKLSERWNCNCPSL